MSLRSGDLSQEEVDQLRKAGKLDDLLKGEQEEVQGCRERDDEGANTGIIEALPSESILLPQTLTKKCTLISVPLSSLPTPSYLLL